MKNQRLNKQHRNDKMPVIDARFATEMPARMVYSRLGIVPATVNSPDHEPPVMVSVAGRNAKKRTANGLTMRADAMARWHAHGATLSDAFRAAYAPRNAAPSAVALRAFFVSRQPGWQEICATYREELREKRSQSTVSIADYVKSRLVLESQDAKQDGARIQSLKLLGMTEGLFTSVQRVERTISPHDLSSLKAKLDQRVKDVLARVSGPSYGPQHALAAPETGLDGRDGTGRALIPDEPHPPEKNTNLLVGSPISNGLLERPPILGGGLSAYTAGGGGGGESPQNPPGGTILVPSDEELEEFNGPLILQGGLRDP